MATVIVCDRCQATGRQVVMMVGSELCPECVRDFAAWVAVGVPEARRERGAWQRHIDALLRLNGYVTPDMLAEATGRPRVAAHSALRDAKRAGRIGQVRSGQWVALQDEQAARAEGLVVE